MKRIISILLVLFMMLALCAMTASADTTPLAGDINGDGKVTPYDALQVQAFLHGEISLTSAQQTAALAACPSIDTLSTAHIVAIFFKPLVGQSSIAPEADGLFHIRAAEDMVLLRSFPYAGFSIDNDIDMSGRSWTPMIFNGYLFGNGNTISNLTVSAANNNVNAGALFVKLGSASNPNATVMNLTLSDASLTTSSTHKYVGLVCGTNYGRITDVLIENGSIGGAINSTTKYAGTMAGMNYGAVSANGEVSCDIAYAATNDLLVGKNQTGATSAHYGNANISQQGTVLLAKEQFTDTSVSRQTAVDEMHAMATIQWTSRNSVSYRDNAVFNVAALKTYFGMKYGHQAASFEHMKELCEYESSNNLYITNGNYPSYDTSSANNIPSDSLVMGTYFSNDCSSSVYWSWMKVSSTFTGERSRRFIPTPSNCSKYGIVMVGNYDPLNEECISQSSHSGFSVWNNQADTADPQYRSLISNTDGSINNEKLNALYESYAQLQPGDSLSHFVRFYSSGAISTDGHTKMVRGVTVVRNGDGSIDPVNSRIATIECGGSGDVVTGITGITTVNTGNTAWRYNNYSFKSYAGFVNDADTALPTASVYYVYVPATISEFATGQREAAYVQLKDSTSPLSGVVSSNYRIVWTSVTIDGDTDKSYTGEFTRDVGLDGSNVEFEGLDDTGFTSGNTVKGILNTRWEASRLTYKSVNLAKHAAHFASLSSGTHTYSITVKLSTGEQKTYSGTFTN